MSVNEESADPTEGAGKRRLSRPSCRSASCSPASRRSGGLAPFWALSKSIADGSNPKPDDVEIVIGHFSRPVVIGTGSFGLGFLLAFAMWLNDKTFWRRRPEVAPTGFLGAVARGGIPPEATA